MAGLVLEGIVGSGKTSVIRYLKKYFLEKDCSMLILDEHETERPMEPLRSSNLSQSVAHLNQLTGIVETFHSIQKPILADPQYAMHFVFERFHLSHCLDIAGLENFHLYKEIDTRLNKFGIKLVVLSIPGNAILERSVVSTKRRRNEQWGQYLNQIAPTDEGVASYYKTQQQNFFKLCQESEIPSMVVDTANRDWEEISFQIVDFLNKS